MNNVDDDVADDDDEKLNIEKDGLEFLEVWSKSWFLS